MRGLLLARERRHSTSVLVDCPGKGALPAIGIRVDKRAGADALRRGWIGLTMKPLIGYGSDVSASRLARLVGDKTSTWTYSRDRTSDLRNLPRRWKFFEGWHRPL